MATEWSHKTALAFCADREGKKMFPFSSGAGSGWKREGRVGEASMICKDKGRCSAPCWEKSLHLATKYIACWVKICQIVYSTHLKLGTTVGIVKYFNIKLLFWYALHDGRSYLLGSFLYVFHRGIKLTLCFMSHILHKVLTGLILHIFLCVSVCLCNWSVFVSTDYLMKKKMFAVYNQFSRYIFYWRKLFRSSLFGFYEFILISRPAGWWEMFSQILSTTICCFFDFFFLQAVLNSPFWSYFKLKENMGWVKIFRFMNNKCRFMCLWASSVQSLISELFSDCAFSENGEEPKVILQKEKKKI